MIAAVVMLTAQIALTPCQIKDVPGPARCGTHRVWENRATKRGRQIDLSVIVLEALGTPRKPDPLVFLQGGPGDAPSFNASFYNRVFANIRQTRDLVLIDLRGTGKSNALTCPELGQPDSSGVLDSDLLGVPALRACRERLEKHADLRHYNTEIAVDDLDEVREALGYKQINLYGTSYGTRVAQVYMRRHPSSLRTVTLKGIVPPSLASPATHARAGDEAWNRLVARCQTDEFCARNYPTVETDLRTVLKRLETLPEMPFLPVPNSPTRIRVSPGLFAEAFRFFLYAPEASARAPALLRDILTNQPGLMENALSARRLFSGDRLAAGFFLSVSCTEDIPYLPKDITPLIHSTFGGDYRLRQQMQACTVWPRGEVSAHHREPTNSNIPTLLLSGEFDPITPPGGGEEVLRGLRNGVHVVIRNNGHPIGNAEQCIGRMMSAFIDNGSAARLNSSCALTIPTVPFEPPRSMPAMTNERR
jgi:pimeloyl-ACP methyl ester carboxylesterase